MSHQKRRKEHPSRRSPGNRTSDEDRPAGLEPIKPSEEQKQVLRKTMPKLPDAAKKRPVNT